MFLHKKLIVKPKKTTPNVNCDAKERIRYYITVKVIKLLT